ncbi:beta-lactamase/transpeptidase-like protein [Calocera cornea HHB12733]|uniref:Beta-lactamase/transpeptidase-like protein n=1 Tax=Calocera cornea HHB12733 TaxID=1353952 RepID=A0A165EW57_9BASI|nr:beta-lactamase/transpeptidase-like protein [Calocera cornea HHB12733]
MSAQEQELKTKLDALLSAATAPGALGIPGVALVVVRKGGNVYEGSSGVADFESGKPFTVDTVVWIASMTKAMTSVAALQCVERGLIGLDEDVSPYVPELQSVQLIDRTAPNLSSGDYVLAPAKEKVTLRRLLTHSNGLIYGHAYPHGVQYMARNGIPSVRTASRGAFKFPAWHEPGKEWHYGMGIDYAGLLVESLSADRLGHIFQKEIRGPLGMDSTVFNLTPQLLERKTTLFQREADGRAVARADEWPHKVEVDMGGGGSWSTARDYAKFVRMLLLGGRTPSGQEILSPATYALGMSGALEPEAKESCNAFHKLPGTTLSKFPGAKRDYALIGMVFEEPLPTGRAAGSVQWAGVANCYWLVDAKKDIGYVLCSQILPSGDPCVQKLLREVESTIYEVLAP